MSLLACGSLPIACPGRLVYEEHVRILVPFARIVNLVPNICIVSAAHQIDMHKETYQGGVLPSTLHERWPDFQQRAIKGRAPWSYSVHASGHLSALMNGRREPPRLLHPHLR